LGDGNRRTPGDLSRIKNPPVAVTLGSAPVMIDGTVRAVAISARVFDFGVCNGKGNGKVNRGEHVDQTPATARALSR